MSLIFSWYKCRRREKNTLKWSSNRYQRPGEGSDTSRQSTGKMGKYIEFVRKSRELKTDMSILWRCVEEVESAKKGPGMVEKEDKSPWEARESLERRWILSIKSYRGFYVWWLRNCFFYISQYIKILNLMLYTWNLYMLYVNYALIKKI